ncbi:unnamed protein product [Moneuplotes crassus]|uniref:Uncharacterized protein n=1 Tax=Euplotes crassus TaxID=5936 RepID=A0AAD1Y0T4_EUPCR|nr:unnamed protein product [Moneuplotes crassus]
MFQCRKNEVSEAALYSESRLHQNLLFSTVKLACDEIVLEYFIWIREFRLDKSSPVKLFDENI